MGFSLSVTFAGCPASPKLFRLIVLGHLPRDRLSMARTSLITDILMLRDLLRRNFER